MFVDKVIVNLHAGDGGDGAVSFRHEKFVDRGGPDGGDGGNGGDVIVQASRNQNTLATFRYQKRLQAEEGQAGSKRRRHGKSGQDLVVMVPIGTMVIKEDGSVITDLTDDNMQAVVAKGGKGGFGNAHFVSSTRQAPRVAEKGEKGEELQVFLELKMIADVGLIGLPNAGKSTLLATVSNAHPEIANYPFTTVRPNLGVVDIDEGTSLLFADIPGLIEGASEGKGLGDEFLRHVERTSVLVHVIDIYQDIAQSYQTIQKELKAYAVDLTKRPQIVVLNKIDGLDKDIVEDKLKELRQIVPAKSLVQAMSAQSGQGVKELLYTVKAVASKQSAKQSKLKDKETLPILRLPDTEDSWKVVKDGDVFTITGKKIERFAMRTDFNNPAGVQRLRDIMKKMGINHELARGGIEDGNKVKIGQHTLRW